MSQAMSLPIRGWRRACGGAVGPGRRGKEFSHLPRAQNTLLIHFSLSLQEPDESGYFYNGVQRYYYNK